MKLVSYLTRYDSKRIFSLKLIRKLVNQPLGTENSGALKQLHDTTQKCLLSLNNPIINTESWDPLL